MTLFLRLQFVRIVECNLESPSPPLPTAQDFFVPLAKILVITGEIISLVGQYDQPLQMLLDLEHVIM